MTKIQCNNCNNVLGKIDEKKIKIYSKRTDNVVYDFDDTCLEVKCRKCCMVSVLKYEDKFSNEINLKQSSLNLLK